MQSGNCLRKIKNDVVCLSIVVKSICTVVVVPLCVVGLISVEMVLGCSPFNNNNNYQQYQQHPHQKSGNKKRMN